jgi:uncharacterized protein YidB (DUF937 family)
MTLLAGGAVAGALLVGLGAAGAVAASRVLSPNDESRAVIDDAASQLGVKPAELSNALEQALKNRVDDAVAAGKLTEEQGTELKERINSGEYPLLFGGLFGHRGLGFGFHHGFGPHDGFGFLESAAAYLGMSEADLRLALEDQTLADIAKEKGKSVDGLLKAIVAAQEKRIDEAVADGRITKAQATELKARLSDRVEALVNGELRRGDGRNRHGFLPGSGFPRGPPPAFGGPRA